MQYHYTLCIAGAVKSQKHLVFPWGYLETAAAVWYLEPFPSDLRAMSSAELETAEPPLLDLSGTRGRILAGAMQVFGERGVDDTTVEHILRAADVSRGTFYQYFRSKDDLLTTVFAYSVHLLVARVGESIAQVEAPFAKIERAVDVYLDLQLEQGRLIHGMLREALRPGSRMAEMREWGMQTMVSFIDASVREAQGREVDLLVYRSLLSAVEGLVLHFQDEGRLTPEKARRIRAAVIPIIERTMALPGDALPELPTA